MIAAYIIGGVAVVCVGIHLFLNRNAELRGLGRDWAGFVACGCSLLYFGFVFGYGVGGGGR